MHKTILPKMMKCSILLSCLLLLSPLAAFAHSGRTDADGGHYNTSTGEYHFHHGYSAHQHPDGICPYEDTQQVDTYADLFETDTRTYSDGYSEGKTAGYYDGLDAGRRMATAEAEDLYHDRLLAAAGIPSAIGAFIIFRTHRSAKKNERTITQLKLKRKEYEDVIKKLQSDAEKMKKYNSDDYQKFLKKLAASSIRKHGHAETGDPSLDYLIPEGYIINADGYPDEEDTPQSQSKFYVFVNPKSGVYHKQSCRYAFSGYRSHILDVPAEYHPCPHCKPDAVDLDWYYEYRSLYEINQNCKK